MVAKNSVATRVETVRTAQHSSAVLRIYEHGIGIVICAAGSITLSDSLGPRFASAKAA